MTAARETSQGPDPCRGNLRCAGFHDPAGTLPLGLGSQYQCCCCDPCRFLRPNSSLNTDKPVPTNFCCRCVPRGFSLVFLPDDPENVCCVEFVQPMFFYHPDFEEYYLARYEGSLFGVTVLVELGRDPYGSCVWEVAATKAGKSIYRESFLVDDEEITCLAVPLEVEIATEGPHECDGVLVLEDFAKAKVPYQAIREPYEPHFIDLYPPCGECFQVCSRICVRGRRHAGDGGEKQFAEFTWFENDDGHGWAYRAPGEDYDERIWLVTDDYGGCWLWPDLEDTGDAEIFDPVMIDPDGCSCELVESLVANVGGDDPPRITIRCGRCSCWEFYCGNCRCLPKELCVLLIEGLEATRAVLSWDGADYRWGSDGDFLRLVTSADQETAACVITPDIYPPFPTPGRHQCTPELLTKQYDPDADVLSFVLEDPIGERFLVVSSLMQDCAQSVCEEATPCNLDCGGHPSAVTVHVHQWAEWGDTSAIYPQEANVEAVCHYFQTADYYDETTHTIKYSCGYLGWLRLPVSTPEWECCLIKVEVRNGMVRFYTPTEITEEDDCQALALAEVELTTETCDPYFGQSDEYVGGILLDWRCLGCTDQTYRYQVTVTE